MTITRTALRATQCGGLPPVASATSAPDGNTRSALIVKAWKRCAAVMFVCAFSLAFQASAVTVSWNPNPESNIATYQLSYGTASGIYSNQLPPVTTTSATVTGLVAGTTYYFVVAAINQLGQQSAASAEVSYLVPGSAPATPSVLLRTGWSLLYVDSQETNGYPATNAFDGSSSTFWSTAFTAGATPPPHEIQIDLGTTYSISGFHYLPRQDNYLIGNIGQYEFYVSTDGINWGTPVATGTFANNKTEKEVLITAGNARYVRLRCITEANGNQDCVVAELNVLGTAATSPPPATSFSTWVATTGLSGQSATLLACPQNDGVSNLLKYAFNLNPTCPDTRVLAPGTGTAGLPCIKPALNGSTVTLHFEFLRRTDAQLTYTPLKSNDLKIWSTLTATETVTAVSTDCERVVIEEPCNPNRSMFGRVVVSSIN